MELLVLIIYGLSLTVVFVFSLGQFHLSLYYRKIKQTPVRGKEGKQSFGEKEIPFVTIQLPIYNELYVVERLLENIAEFDYPKNKFEVQVLDDSTDETVEIIRKKIETLTSRGVDIQHIRRKDRIGFKAGALQYGLDFAKGEFIAIFDADFLPDPDFLSQTLPHFEEEKVGMVQTRWSHINQNYSLLTKLQAFGLDAHFTVEQSGRNFAGSFINFNGTGGVWRKSCILDAGGWQPDTLTEDLDLSYRAQLKNWEFLYLEEVTTPAELPVTIPAIKSQQYRWNKGAAETAKKHIPTILSSNLGFRRKLHAVFHLLNSSVFMFLFVAAMLSVPALFIKDAHHEWELAFHLASIFLLGFMGITYFYWLSSKRVSPKKTFSYFAKNFPLFMSMSMGLSLHNGIAVFEGFIGRKTPFVRTPKFNIKNSGDKWKGNVYLKNKLSWATLIEGLLALYFSFGIYSGIRLGDFGLLPFHFFLFLGFGTIFYMSLKTSGLFHLLFVKKKLQV
ncbi:glycosyltransferase family 2 protein [Flammeovirgaceae bacterium SG7u.111]|nr:glycosyltransferase family 2 protein [Flammeovirgaceae bacterium SG7u.132]WPO35968.1 glycosyltransferase family 2 protein [Flammeovirgaceae bacterium SG7u.111]